MAAPRLTAIANTRALWNDGDSVLTDSSGNGYTLTASGSSAFEAGYDNSANRAFNFDGTWYGYRTGSLGLTNASDITFQFRVKIETAPSSGATFGFWNLVTNDAPNQRKNIRFAYKNNAGTMQLLMRDVSTNAQTYNTTLTVGVWYDLALVVDVTGSKLRAYLQQTGTNSLVEILNVANASGNSGNDVGIEVGSDMDVLGTIPSASNRGDFAIDNFRITSTARTFSEISDDFYSNIKPLGVIAAS